MPLSLSCQTCGAEMLASLELRTADCPYCKSPAVIDRPPSADRPAPTFALGFEVPRDRAFARVAEWLSTRSLFARSDFKRAALADLRGVYLPAYLYSAAASSTFRAEIGERYSEEEEVENGKAATRTRTLRKTEWRPLAGRYAQSVADLVVTASKGLSIEELERIGPFDLAGLRRYQPALVSGWIAEEPTLTPAQGLELARQEAMARVAASLERFMPGDEHRGLEFETTLANEVVEPCLLPVWIAALRTHAKKPVARVLVNGQTGEVFGRVPISWLKVAAASLGILGVLVALALVLQRSS